MITKNEAIKQIKIALSVDDFKRAIDKAIKHNISPKEFADIAVEVKNKKQ